MSDFPVQALIPIGAIVAALVAGFFSVLSLIVSKEQKISEFRQQWIDSLRQELSDHMAAVVSLSSMRELQSDTDTEFVKETGNIQERVTATYTSIKLRVNPDDSDQKIKSLNREVLRLLDEGRTLYNDKKWKEARVNCNELTEASIPMLKEEWKRVKRGERIYVWSRRVATGIFALSLIALIWTSVEFWPSAGEIGADERPIVEKAAQDNLQDMPKTSENPDK